jgi:uncharacterized protein (DUF2252 family)
MTNIKLFWKELASKKEITKQDMATLAIVRALEKEDPHSATMSYLNKSFTLISNKIKLALENHYGKHYEISNVVKHSASFQRLKDIIFNH